MGWLAGFLVLMQLGERFAFEGDEKAVCSQFCVRELAVSYTHLTLPTIYSV